MRRIAFISIAVFIVMTQACAHETIYGLRETEWFDLLQDGKPLPETFTSNRSLDAASRLGKGAFVYLALYAKKMGNDDLAVRLLEKAVTAETGIYKTRAVSMLAELYAGASDGEALIRLCRSDAGRELGGYKRELYKAGALLARASYQEAAEALESIRTEYPRETDAPGLSAMLIEAAYKAGNGRWVDEYINLITMESSRNFYAALAAALNVLRSAVPNEAADIARILGDNALHISEGRRLVGARQYGAAVTVFRRCVTKNVSTQLPAKQAASLFLTLPRYAASDAARAFIGASKKEGLSAFQYIENTKLDRAPDAARDYFNIFWLGRFYREEKRWKEAAGCFSRAKALASVPADFDPAAWYEIDSLAQAGLTHEAVSVLADALPRSGNASYYSDIVETVSRDALTKKQWRVLAALENACANYAENSDSSRMSYICARLAQSGLLGAADIAKALGVSTVKLDEYIDACFRKAAAHENGTWYRLLSLYRLGDPLTGLLPAAAPKKDTTPLDEYTLGLARFGLAETIRAELADDFYSLNRTTIQSIARAFAKRGMHAASYKFIAAYFAKQKNIPTQSDAALLWPKPYADEIQSAAKSTGLDEHRIYGLVRSESAFDPKASSIPGAVGLAQLMPETAKETAKALGMTEYKLTNPDDNIRIGAAYLASLIRRFEGKFFLAVFAYNGGPTRLRRWMKTLSHLPLDLMLDALPFAETRQYGRNVIQAAFFYELIYGAQNVREYLSLLLAEI